MPRGGSRPNSGRPKGSVGLLTIGREAPRPDYKALIEMRMAAKILRNIMVDAHNEYTAAKPSQKKPLLSPLRESTKDYLRALKEIVPYEEARLAAITVALPPPPQQPGDNARVVNLKIFEDTGTALGLIEVLADRGVTEATEDGDDDDL